MLFFTSRCCQILILSYVPLIFTQANPYFPMSPPCIFCLPSPDKTLFSNTYAYCRFDDYPVTPGHLLIIPYRHIRSFFDATNEEQAAMMDLVRSGKEYLHEKYHPQGYLDMERFDLSCKSLNGISKENCKIFITYY